MKRIKLTLMRGGLPLIFCLLLLLPASAPARGMPTVSIALSSAQARPGETVTAAVFIRNGVNIAGADVGIETDDCLRVIGRKQGPYLPTPRGGGFIAYEATSDHSTRLAVAITDRTAVANEDDIFYFVEMEVVCAGGTARIKVGFAELSAYVDPKAPQVELIAYTRDAGTLLTQYATLQIISGGVVRGRPPLPIAPPVRTPM